MTKSKITHADVIQKKGTFADTVRKNIINGIREFTATSNYEKNYFVLVNHGAFDVLMTGYTYTHNQSLLSEMRTYGVVINGKFYTTESHPYIEDLTGFGLSAENEKFFGASLKNVYEGLINEMRSKIMAHLTQMDEDSIKIPSQTKDHIRKIVNISNYIFEGTQPKFEIPPFIIRRDPVDIEAIRYLIQGNTALDTWLEEILNKKESKDDLYETYYKFLVQKRMFEERMANLSTEEIASREINTVLEKAFKDGKRSVRLIIEAKNTELVGQEIECKIQPYKKFKEDGLPTLWCEPQDKAEWINFTNNSLEDYRTLPASLVKKITYAKNVLYERKHT